MKLKSFLQIYFAGLVALLIIINACTMNKRVYRSGYNIEWNGAKKNPLKRDLANHPRANNPISNPLNENVNPYAVNATASANTKHTFLSEKITTENFTVLKKINNATFIEGCDTIVFKNGLKIKAKVLEISANEVKYKMCDNPEGPTFIKNTADVSIISHANGTFTEVSTSNNILGQTNYQNTNQPKPKTPDRQTSSATSGKSQLIAVLLCGFLGFFGIHRFYLGHIGIGILMLFTGGCCGVLWLIDFIRIIMGDLKPKDGDYSEKF